MGGNGVGQWDSATGQFNGFWNWQNSNLDSSGHHAITKRAGTMWVGSGGSGVYWFDGTNWNHVTLSPGGYSYESNNVRSMTVDTNNNLWVASEYGLRKFEAGNNTTFTLYDTSNTPLTSAGMTDVEADLMAASGWALMRDSRDSTVRLGRFTTRPIRECLARLSLTWRVVPVMDLSRSQAIKAALFRTPAASASSTARPGLTSRRRIRH